VFAIRISGLEVRVSVTYSVLACQLQKLLSFLWKMRIIIRIARDLEENACGLFCLIAKETEGNFRTVDR
jgi:hypothetical protein